MAFRSASRNGRWARVRTKDEPAGRHNVSAPSDVESIRPRHTRSIHVKMYLVSLGVGLIVGILYALLSVRSPAPPVVALLGLLGMLLGEQLVPIVKRALSGNPINATWI